MRVEKRRAVIPCEGDRSSAVTAGLATDDGRFDLVHRVVLRHIPLTDFSFSSVTDSNPVYVVLSPGAFSRLCRDIAGCEVAADLPNRPVASRSGDGWLLTRK